MEIQSDFQDGDYALAVDTTVFSIKETWGCEALTKSYISLWPAQHATFAYQASGADM